MLVFALWGPKKLKQEEQGEVKNKDFAKKQKTKNIQKHLEKLHLFQELHLHLMGKFPIRTG